MVTSSDKGYLDFFDETFNVDIKDTEKRLSIFDGLLVAVKDDNSERWTAKVLIEIFNNQGNVDINKTITDIHKDISSWNFDVVYDSDIKKIRFEITGEDNKTIYWILNTKLVNFINFN